MNKETTINLIVMQEFKDTLIENKKEFISWSDIYLVVSNSLYYNCNLQHKDVPSETTLRMVYFKVLQKDDEFIEEHGVPISKNSVGIKLSKDLKEIKEYIDGETKRAKALFTKLKPIKKQYMRLNHLINFNKIGE